MKKMKLKLFPKIFLSFFVLVLVVVLGITAITYYQSSTLLEKDISEKLDLVVGEKVGMMEQIIGNSRAIGNLIADNNEIKQYVNFSNTNPGIKQNNNISMYLGASFDEGKGLYENIFISGKGGKILLDGIKGNSIGTDLHGMGFFDTAITGTQILGNVMVSPVTGRPVIVVGTPIKSGQQTIGVAAVAMEFNVLTKPITDSKIGKTGFTFIVNKQGLVLAHPNKDHVMKMDLSKEASLAEINRRMNQEQQGQGIYTKDGIEKMMSFSQVPDSEFNIGSVIETEEIYKPVNSLLLKLILVGGAAVLIALAVAFWLAGSLTGPIREIGLAVRKAADGDLTQQLTIRREDELGTLADTFQMMLLNLKNMIAQIDFTSRSVASTSQQLSSNTQEATKTIQQVAASMEQISIGSGEQAKSATHTLKIAEQVSQAIEQIAAGAQDQSRNVVDTSTIVTDMAAKIDKMAEGMMAVKEVSEQNGIVATEGGKVVEMTVTGMVRVKDTSTDTAHKINELGQQSQKIGEIIQVIDDIAEQTNLLALNAAIEAARAGEHGKGFAVVADEVRKLAERSGKATKEIAQLITDIQHGTKLAVESMDIGSKEVSEGVTLAQEAGQALNKIVEGVKAADIRVSEIMGLINDVMHSSQEVTTAVNNVAAITEENTAATQEISASTEQVNIATQNVAAISEENAASSEEVATSTEELTASIEEISSSSDQLAAMAKEMQTLVNQFKF